MALKRKPRKTPAAVEVAPGTEPVVDSTTEDDGVLVEERKAEPAKPTQPAHRGYDYDRGF
jgi:hypothetical protein